MKNLLVAIDESPRARDVLNAAAELASRLDVKIVLLRVVSLPVGLPATVYTLPPDQVTGLLVQDALDRAHEFANLLAPGVIAKTRVEVGVPWQQICDIAKEESALMIVIGAHAYKGLDHLLGTTAARVVNHANRTVVVVRKPPVKN
jgi:nucleotide-binding universal stress UspA family protein